jgi:Zn ribbon nucleic-acid-binding protein
MCVDCNSDDSVYMLNNALFKTVTWTDCLECGNAERQSEKSHVGVLFHASQLPAERSSLYINVIGNLH